MDISELKELITELTSAVSGRGGGDAVDRFEEGLEQVRLAMSEKEWERSEKLREEAKQKQKEKWKKLNSGFILIRPLKWLLWGVWWLYSYPFVLLINLCRKFYTFCISEGEVARYITDFPIPSGKDDLMEFMEDMAERHSAEYVPRVALAYREKVRACAKKARRSYFSDEDVRDTIAECTSFSLGNMSMFARIALGVIAFIVFVVIVKAILGLF